MGNDNTPRLGSTTSPRLRLVCVEGREAESSPRENEKNAKSENHPTRRDDGRTPNPRAAEKAIAEALELPEETLDLLARDQPEQE
jgi:hypothetical protein